MANHDTTWKIMINPNAILIMHFHQGRLAMATAVELEADGVVGAYVGAVEAACATGVVD